MRAIDIHVHVPRHPELAEYGIEPGLRKMFRMDGEPDSVEQMAARYAAADVKAVIFSVDAETETGDRPDPNDLCA